MTVTDPLLDGANGTLTGGPIATLAPGAVDTATFSGSYTIQQSDIDAQSVSNQATATERHLMEMMSATFRMTTAT
ncbi:DUF7507 domain-containing protein [Nonlabens agnitus]|uniref:DUF7507 domain-containing protein n=1 Tax=Nonlabens agnitus TaxID=870484 RepID=A0A2S9WQ43_9FLAO|nr:hypothetical protein [Nonlabens agnitus]PRP65608.1 hypothetical protein BST86_00125 [Nonlabens agnitus]